ncbi:DegT/DnrJ/EryC1/StrS family aminotransferase [Leifsonia sp. NPDC058248]|uniref:DegT/DnrJ/EryC1/StrS family aminotransferase n=1 Tax=Leifsonia sp. NPDC058248 TaxID=3346402 RepID=UPI0036DCFA2C
MESGLSRTAVDSAEWQAIPVFERPLHVGQPNIGDRAMFDGLVDQMFERRWLSNDGPLVQDFEQRIADFAGVKHCVAMSNGTAALEIAIRALGLSGEVIVPSYTFVATAHALQWQGITPVFADIDPLTHNLDPESVRRMITPRTTGIIGVHLWGRPAPVRELQEIADEHGLQLMFDAAHAFATTLGGKRIGGFGRAEIFSFHATKFFNTFEGGAVVTDDDEIAAAARLMRNFGFAGHDNVVSDGTNAKMTEVCAAMGLTNLAGVDAVIETNHRNYTAYQDALSGIPGVRLTQYDEAEECNFQYITVEVDDGPVSRDEIVAALISKNVLARKYFWPGCHRMQPYRDLYPDAGALLPNTEKVAARVIVLPTGTAVDEDAVASISEMIRVLTGGHAL